MKERTSFASSKFNVSSWSMVYKFVVNLSAAKKNSTTVKYIINAQYLYSIF